VGVDPYSNFIPWKISLKEVGMEAEVRRHILSKKLKQAIRKENVGMIHRVGKELETHGIDINSLDRYGNGGSTALMLASENPNPAMLNVLCELGADVNATDYTHNTALSYAAGNGNSSCVIALCSKPDIDPNITRTDAQWLGESPLMYACWKCTPEAVEALIACGAEVAVARQVDDRFTPLMYAINNLHGPGAARRIVDMLLDEGADIYALDSDGDAVFNHHGWEQVRTAGPGRHLNTPNIYRARKRALSVGKTRRNAIQREANLMPPYGKNFVVLQSKYNSNPAFKRESLGPTNLSLVRNLIGGRNTRRKNIWKR